jgi:hypothetical protein
MSFNKAGVQEITRAVPSAGRRAAEGSERRGRASSDGGECSARIAAKLVGCCRRMAPPESIECACLTEKQARREDQKLSEDAGSPHTSTLRPGSAIHASQRPP